METLNGVSDLQKIDSAGTDGLAGVHNSLAYRVHEIERHFHSYERWFELAAAPVGTTHRADPAGTGAGVFTIDAGNTIYGAWLQLLGSTDTPAIADSVYYDPHKLLMTAAERNEIYVMQIGFGASGAAALEAGTYTEVVFHPQSNVIDSGPVVVQSRRHAAGELMWARCLCPGFDTGLLSFVIGIHEYPG
jgi:hypothetical protein